MLCCTTIAAWAGTGNGTKENPYSGEWKVEDVLNPSSPKEVYLAYDVKLVPFGEGKITVFDTVLEAVVTEGLSPWNVGADLIGDNPIEAYKEYCSLNPNRKKQTFVVTDFAVLGDVITNLGVKGDVRLRGHFSGTYTWVDQAKSLIQKQEQYADFADYIYTAPTEKMVYLQQFEFFQGSDFTSLKEDSLSLPFDRNIRSGVNSIFTYVLKPEPNVPVEEQIPAEERPEYSYKFSSYLKDAYANTLSKEDVADDVQALLQTVYFLSNSQATDKSAITLIDRGGEYILEADNNLGTGHKKKLTLTCDPDCNVKHAGGSRMGEYFEVKVNIASGYPYDVEDYQGKKMHLSVFDADNKPVVNNAEFAINASADKAKMEYVMSYSQKFWLKSTKFTIKLSGDLLKEEKVVTFDALPNYVALEEAIQIADSICNEIREKHALYVYNVNILKNAIVIAKEGLNLSAFQQSEINQYCKDLVDVIKSVQEDMKKGFVEVKDAKGLKDAIDKDPGAKIHLTNDIDMSLFADYLQGDIDNKFHGVINGIKDPNAPEGPTYTITGGSENNMPLFNGLTKAAFVNIAFKDFKISSGENLGVISTLAEHSIFKNIKMESITISGIASALKTSSVGTIAGTATESCMFDNIDVSNSHISGGDWVGGVVGDCDNCMLRNCHINSDVLIHSPNSSGGIAGRASQLSVIADCENQAVVGSNGRYAGGIVGLADRKYIIKHEFINDHRTVPHVWEYSGADFFNCTNKGKILPANKEECENCFEGKNFTINTTTYTGGICGASFGFRGDGGGLYNSIGNENVINQCSNYGKIYGKRAGGILGICANLKINNCLNACKSLTLGGIVYDVQDTRHNASDAYATRSTIPCKITNCLSLSDCPLVYNNNENTSSESINNFSYVSDDPKHTPADYETCVTDETIKSGVLARWLNNSISNRDKGIEPWRQNLELQGDETEVDSHPVLDPSHRVVTSELMSNYDLEITSAEELKSFAERVNNGEQFIRAYLAADIELKDKWTPIGKDEDGKRFRGIFDGRGHTINGLKCSSDINEPLGLFGAVDANAEICNVIIGKDCEIWNIWESYNWKVEADEGVGGIVGKVSIKSNQGTVIIENCGNYAEILASKHGGGILGNVATTNGKVYVNNCFNMGKIVARFGNSALLCGYTQNHAVVSNCWSGGELRHGGYTMYPNPYDWTNSKGQCECFVGYEDQFDIKNCYVVSPATNVDYWDRYGLQDGVTIHENYDDLANGKLAYILNGNSNDATKSLIWQQNLGTDKNPVFGNKGVYHTRDVKEEYGTVCLPYELSCSNPNISYYKFDRAIYTDDGVQLKFDLQIAMNNQGGKIFAGVPVLFRVRNTGENSFTDTANSVLIDNPNNPKTQEGWGFYGTFTRTVFADPDAMSIYYVANGAIKNAERTIVAPYRAYFRGQSFEELKKLYGSLAKVRIVLEDEDGETTAIELVGDELVPVSNGKTYSLMGTEVGDDYRGIVIKNGKKMIQK